MIVTQTAQTAYCQCDKCGLEYEVSQRRLSAKRTSLCTSCTATPLKTVTYGKDFCVPWRKDFDANDNPIKQGKLYRPGVRSCGHSDCVKLSHITPTTPEPQRIKVTATLLQQLKTIRDQYPHKATGVTTCQLDFCDLPHLAKGLCSKHDANYRKNKGN